MEFCKNGNSIILNRESAESDEVYFNRGWFIISQPKLNNFNELEQLSKVWSNYKYKGCSYSHSLNKQITDMEKHMN
jgi:hypothetical protein